jgi:hypothetical protein
VTLDAERCAGVTLEARGEALEAREAREARG